VAFINPPQEEPSACIFLLRIPPTRITNFSCIRNGYPP
jgi:hypothetical protein